MRLIYILSLSFIVKIAVSQGVYAPLNNDYYQLIDRYEIKSGSLSNQFHSNVKPFTRESIVALTSIIDTNYIKKLSKVDSFNRLYLQNDSWEFLPDSLQKQADSRNPFYVFLKKKSDAIAFHNDDFDIHASPIFNFSYGKEGSNYTKFSGNNLYINTRGVEIRGLLNKKLGFYTMLTENQMPMPLYVRNYITQYKDLGFPYEGFTKVVNVDYDRMLLDYFSARGYIIFKPIKSLTLQFGHDKNFIGSGIRSMILSDFSSPYLQLKAMLQIGKFQYTNIVAEMRNNQVPRTASGDTPIPPKYMAFHHLNVNITKNINVGLFESVMFGKRSIGFDLNYLNPVIFYRFVEGYLGSADNSMVGIDAKINILRRFSLYGQYVLDEYNKKELKQYPNWWANKHAGQVGLKYIDVLGIKNFDLQAEYNTARPFIYSHFSTYSSFVNFNLPIAHPLGANFKEWIFVARTQPFKRLFVNLTYMNAIKGEDFDAANWGGNVLRLNSDTRATDTDNIIGQGRKTHINLFELNTSFMLKHNLFADVRWLYRKNDSQDTNFDYKNSQIMFGLRWNIAQRSYLF